MYMKFAIFTTSNNPSGVRVVYKFIKTLRGAWSCSSLMSAENPRFQLQYQSEGQVSKEMIN